MTWWRGRWRCSRRCPSSWPPGARPAPSCWSTRSRTSTGPSSRLALLLAAPANRIFLVGDDDQSIYGWRLADVRRVLDLAGRLPGLHRHDLVTDFRCPAPVVEPARSVSSRSNAERFAKIVARPGRGRTGTSSRRTPPTTSGRDILATWPTVPTEPGGGHGPSQSAATGVTGRPHAILARTNRELLPAAAIALELRIPFRAESGLALPLEDPASTESSRRSKRPQATSRCSSGWPASAPASSGTRQARLTSPEFERSSVAADSQPMATLSFDDLLAAVLAWAAPYRDASEFSAVPSGPAGSPSRTSRRDDAALTLATAPLDQGSRVRSRGGRRHGCGPFPSQRSLDEADDPDRALEEERAWPTSPGPVPGGR